MRSISSCGVRVRSSASKRPHRHQPKTRCIDGPASVWRQPSRSGPGRRGRAGCGGSDRPVPGLRWSHRLRWPGGRRRWPRCAGPTCTAAPHHIEHCPVALHEVAQPLRDRQRPLAHRQARQDVIREVCSRRHHASRVTQRGKRKSQHGPEACLPIAYPARPAATAPNSPAVDGQNYSNPGERRTARSAPRPPTGPDLHPEQNAAHRPTQRNPHAHLPH